MSKSIMFRWFLFHSGLFLYFSILMLAAGRAHGATNADVNVNVDANFDDPIAGTFLDSGSCQVIEESPGVWNVTTPNTGSGAPKVTKVKESEVTSRVEALMTRELKTNGLRSFAGGAYKVHLECSAANIHLAINLPPRNGAPGLCARTSLQANSLTVLSNNEAQSGVSCQGERPLFLVVGAHDPAALPSVLSTLGSASYDSTVDNGKVQGDRTIVVQLKKDLVFRESEARARIESDPRLKGLLEYVEYDKVNGIAGASQPLFTGQYRGF